MMRELLDTLSQRFQLTQTATQAGGRELTFYHPSSVDDLLDEEAFNRDGRIPYWSELWPAARVLADLLVPMAGNRQRLLELGCGVGCGAIAASIAGFDVTASDYYAEALDFVRLNAGANHVEPPQALVLDWRAWPRSLRRLTRSSRPTCCTSRNLASWSRRPSIVRCDPAAGRS